MSSVKWGRIGGQLGVVDKLGRFAGLYPQPVIKRGDNFATSWAAVPLGPRTCPRKENRGCACSAWATDISPARRDRILGRFSHVVAPAVGGFCPYPQLAEKKGGIPPFDNFPLFFQGLIARVWAHVSIFQKLSSFFKPT